MSHLSANYPTANLLISNTPTSGTASAANAMTRANATTAKGRESSASIPGSAKSIGTTFLNLLAQELQNQDPTAPVDSTAMVGQMISLNQLDQLISINQGITGGASAGVTGTAQTPVQTAKVATALLSPSSTAASGQLPFDPKTMMPTGFVNVPAKNFTSASPTVSAMPSPNRTNNTSGGK